MEKKSFRPIAAVSWFMAMEVNRAVLLSINQISGKPTFDGSIKSVGK